MAKKRLLNILNLVITQGVKFGSIQSALNRGRGTFFLMESLFEGC